MINVLLFAYLQDEAGKEKIILTDAPLTVQQLKQKLADDYGLKKLDNVMVAINEEYADDNDLIQNGDTVALIPPVSGG